MTKMRMFDPKQAKEKREAGGGGLMLVLVCLFAVAGCLSVSGIRWPF